MRHFPLAALIGLGALAGAPGRARADVMYELSGTFAGTQSGTTGLLNGSFSGYYTVSSTPFPPGALSGIDVTLFDTTHTPVLVLNEFGSDDFVTQNVLQITDPNPLSPAYQFTVDFAAPYDGIGLGVVTGGLLDLDNNGSSGSQIRITSGQTAAFIPEPSTYALTGVMAVAVAAVVLLRRDRAS